MFCIDVCIQVVTKVQGVGAYEKEPVNLWHCMQNASLIIRFLSSHTCEKVGMCTARGNTAHSYT